MQKTQPDLNRYFVLPNPGLRAYFARTVRGNDEDYRTPFYDKRDREWVLEKWDRIFDSSPVQSKLPGLFDFEKEMRSKVGPMSVQLPLKDRIESIEAYYATPKALPVDERALEATIEFFRTISGLRLRGREATVNKMRLNTNSGSPWFTKRRIALLKPFVDKELTDILGWRGQEGGIFDEDVKQRVIWMSPLELNIEELQFYQPAIEAVQKHKLIPAYVSMECVDDEVTALFDTKGHDDVVICTDFSKFDQHFQQVMQDSAEYIERALATWNEGTERWFGSIYNQKFTIPLVCSESLMFTGHHGMGSGSGGTNFDESLAHKSLQFEAALSADARLNPHSMAYGDDGILTYPGISVDHIIKTYTAHGQEMNVDKQMISKTDCVVLRRWHSTSYRNGNGTMVGVYSTYRALGRLMAQERYYDPDKWGKEQVVLRAWSIIENCKYHPLIDEFIDFCIKGDKYRLGVDIPGFMDNVDRIAQRSIELMPDFMGYTKTLQTQKLGIKSWYIYNYLRRKYS
jgi:hypothetical protein